MTKTEAIKIQQLIHDNTFLFNSTYNEIKQSTEMAIEALESQEPPIKTGYWKAVYRDEDNTLTGYLCSVCDHDAGFYRTNYCPACGAKLRKFEPMTAQEAIKWLTPPLALSNGDPTDPIQKHWIAYRMACRSLDAWTKVRGLVEALKIVNEDSEESYSKAIDDALLVIDSEINDDEFADLYEKM